MEIPKFKFFNRKAPENNAGPDNVVSKEQYLQSTINPANEHRRAEIAGKAKRGTKITTDGDKIEMLVSEDGAILEYLNRTDFTEVEQRKMREAIANKQEKIRQEKTSQN